MLTAVRGLNLFKPGEEEGGSKSNFRVFILDEEDFSFLWDFALEGCEDFGGMTLFNINRDEVGEIYRSTALGQIKGVFLIVPNLNLKTARP